MNGEGTTKYFEQATKLDSVLSKYTSKLGMDAKSIRRWQCPRALVIQEWILREAALC